MIFESNIPSTCLDRYSKDELLSFAAELYELKLERLEAIHEELRTGNRNKKRLEWIVRNLHRCGKCSI